MKKQINIDKLSILRGKERTPFEKIRVKFITIGWDASIEFDPNYGWYILTTKSSPSDGIELRRVKPFKIISYDDLFSSIKLQRKLKSELVEILPYKIYKGDRVFFPDVSDYLDFMSEAKFGLFGKFFQTLQISLSELDKTEANKNDKV
jgi:hypothetical protein